MKNKFPLKVRNIPFSLAECLKRFRSVAEFIEDASWFPGGISWVLDRSAASIQVEFNESEINHYKNGWKSWGKNPEGTIFLQQEATHGGYHHTVNRFIEPTYIKLKSVPLRANKLNYPFIAQRENAYRALLGPDSPEKTEAIKTNDLFFAAFEVNFGLLTAISLFQTIEENYNEIMNCGRCPFFLYLWVYHMTEEMEHVHVALDVYENAYKEKILSKENAPKVFALIDTSVDMRNFMLLTIGVNNGFQMTQDEIMAGPMRKKFDLLRSQFSKGVDLDSLADLRRNYVDLADRKWLPELAKLVQNSLASPLSSPMRKAA